MRKHYFVSYIYIGKNGKTAISNCVIDRKRAKDVEDINSMIKSIESEVVEKYNAIEGSVNILSLTKL